MGRCFDVMASAHYEIDTRKTLLWWATYCDDTVLVKALLERGANPNQPDVAVNNADLHLTDLNTISPFKMALQNNFDCFNILAQHAMTGSHKSMNLFSTLQNSEENQIKIALNAGRPWTRKEIQNGCRYRPTMPATAFDFLKKIMLTHELDILLSNFHLEQNSILLLKKEWDQIPGENFWCKRRKRKTMIVNLSMV